ncbi:methyltransferase domain-containing protein [Sinomicrobium pectinilyticum]|uniref:Methyltransferase domain-containing protein n=1 Tax=Sinomicrobium pectinilyticum TaxID=1084421 RepID=A0A3N0D0G9_SINP1|nr:class I SAM-dependent methyltransferase [Sinomicrobium pectinilyticum]RNL69150.1 methyltransferase domain-containing protein [Sinomicrobium pectinilyticum]
MHFISEVLENYVEKSTDNEPELLQELSRETHLRVLRPRMLSGHFQGRFLSFISKLKSPEYILEVGTYTGYSALCMAEGIRKGGELHTIDINEELYDLQRRYFDRSGYGEQIKQHTGDALDIIPSLNIKFDLAFIDADKENYHTYFDLIIHKMNKGGLILSDNVLWSGKVVEEVKPNDKSTIALLEYNKKLKEDSRVETLLLPIRDGLTICRVI